MAQRGGARAGAGRKPIGPDLCLQMEPEFFKALDRTRRRTKHTRAECLRVAIERMLDSTGRRKLEVVHETPGGTKRGYHFRVPEELRQRLDVYASRNDASLAELVRTALQLMAKEPAS